MRKLIKFISSKIRTFLKLGFFIKKNISVCICSCKLYFMYLIVRIWSGIQLKNTYLKIKVLAVDKTWKKKYVKMV